MESCGDCLVLEHRLSEASEHYVDLIVQQNRVMRDNHREASGLEDAIREARSRRTSVARIFFPIAELMVTHTPKPRLQP